jgi:hypothetical protein
MCDPRLIVRKAGYKGRGVYTLDEMYEGQLIERAPVILFVNSRTKSKVLDRYTFEWDDDTAALALGKCSLFNHSFDPNVLYKVYRNKQMIEFTARRYIQCWEELVINYNRDPEDRSPVGFPVR